MRTFILIVILLFSCFSCVHAESLLESDYSFIDNAFNGIKPVTNKQFDDTINKLTPKPIEDSFKGKLKAFLFGRQYGVEPQPTAQDKEIETASDQQAIKDLTNGIHYIRLVVPIVASNGSIIPLGNYKIKEEIDNNTAYLNFYQGHTHYGRLKLTHYEDNLKNDNDIAYSRVDIVSDEIIRIVYSTIEDTKCAIGKVYLQN